MIRSLLLALLGLVLATAFMRTVIDAGRLAIAVLFAAFVGVTGGLIAGFGAASGATGALIGFGCFAVTLAIVRRRREPVEAEVEALEQSPPRRFGLWRRRSDRALDPDPVQSAAWRDAQALAAPGDHRVARARESCEALAAAARQAPLDAGLRDCAAMIAHSVPGIVEIAHRELDGAPPFAHAARIEEMIELLDQLGDEADRARAHARRPEDSPYAVHRAYLETRRRDRGERL